MYLNVKRTIVNPIYFMPRHSYYGSKYTNFFSTYKHIEYFNSFQNVYRFPKITAVSQAMTCILLQKFSIVSSFGQIPESKVKVSALFNRQSSYDVKYFIYSIVIKYILDISKPSLN